MLAILAPARACACGWLRVAPGGRRAPRSEPCANLRALPGGRARPERFGTADWSHVMLSIYNITIDIARDAARAANTIAQYDSDLARQLRRAATSIPLNVAEAAGSTGGNRRQRYATALGSAYEVRACLDVATAMDYIAGLDHDQLDKLDRIIATLFKVCR